MTPTSGGLRHRATSALRRLHPRPGSSASDRRRARVRIPGRLHEGRSRSRFARIVRPSATRPTILNTEGFENRCLINARVCLRLLPLSAIFLQSAEVASRRKSATYEFRKSAQSGGSETNGQRERISGFGRCVAVRRFTRRARGYWRFLWARKPPENVGRGRTGGRDGIRTPGTESSLDSCNFNGLLRTDFVLARECSFGSIEHQRHCSTRQVRTLPGGTSARPG